MLADGARLAEKPGPEDEDTYKVDFTVGTGDREVLVLLAAQRRRAGPKPVVRSEDFLGLLLAHLRRRELRCLKEIETEAH